MYWIAPVIWSAAIAGLPRDLERPTRCIIVLPAAFAMALASRVMLRSLRAEYSIYYDPPLFILFMVAVTAVLWFGTMVLRWTAAGVLEAQRGFRKLAGYRALPALVAALRAHAAQLDRTEGKLDTARNAA